MKKIITKIILISFILRAILQFNAIEDAFALTNNWDFTVPANYTLSDATKIKISGATTKLIYNLVHQGSVTNATTLNGARKVIVDGNYAYVSAYLNNSITVVDISNPASPTVATTIINGGGGGAGAALSGPVDMIKEGNYIYVASFTSNALEIIDVSNPLVPLHAGKFVDNATSRLAGATGIAKSGNYVYIASYTDDAIQVIDVTNPLTPVLPTGGARGVLRANGGRLNGAIDVEVSGNYAYITAQLNNSLQVIDISVKNTPAFAGQIINGGLALLSAPQGLNLSGTTAFVASSASNALEVINIATPTAPAHVSSIINGGTTLLTSPRGLKTKDDFAVVASYTSNALEVVNKSTIGTLAHESSLVNAGATRLSGVYDVFNSGSYFYAASYVSDALEIAKGQYDTAGPSIVPNTAYTYTGSIDSLSQTYGTNNAGNVTYQLSKNNGTTWYYFNGSSWVSTLSGTIASNSSSVINANIDGFNALGGGTGQFKWKAFLNSNGDQKVELTGVSIFLDKEPPVISSSNIASGSLMPGGNFNINLNYTDVGVGINTSSGDTVALYKWDGVSSWGADISATKLNLAGKSITTTGATYPTNNLVFGKYRVDFSIKDKNANLTSTGIVFYVDQPEIIVSTGSLDIGNLTVGTNSFSAGEITITINTVGATFQVLMNKTTPMIESHSFELVDWNGTKGIGYDKFPYASTITKINTNEVLANQSGSINVNGLRNTYTYKVKMGAFIDNLQASGNYQANLSFGVNLSY